MNDFFPTKGFTVAEFAAINDCSIERAVEIISAQNERINESIGQRRAAAQAALEAAGDTSDFWLVGSEGRFESHEHWGFTKPDGTTVLENKSETFARQAKVFA